MAGEEIGAVPRKRTPASSSFSLLWTARLIAAFLLVACALALRWEPLVDRDLYSDEALQATITRSWLEEGTLNNFGFSRFTPSVQFSNDTWVYYPPGFYVAQAPFLRVEPVHPAAVRAPVLIANLLWLVGLPLLAALALRDEIAGWVAAVLATFTMAHITMSTTSLPYTLAPALAMAAAFAVARANRRGRGWVLAGLAVAVAFYVQPINLTFTVLLALAVLSGSSWHRYSGRGLLIAASVAAIVCLPWMLFSSNASTPIGIFLARATNYSLAGQAGLIGAQFDLLLPSLPLKLFYLAGLVQVFRAPRPQRWGLALLALVSLMPLGFLLARSMWVTPRHVFGASVGVALVTAVGLSTCVRAVVAWTGGPPASLDRASSVVSIALALILAFLPYRTDLLRARSPGPFDASALVLLGPAAMEFNHRTAVSEAAAIIDQSYRGEPIIAPVGLSEAHYLGRFVHDRNTPEAAARAWELARAGPVWVFMGDNFAPVPDEFDRTIRRHGRLMFRSPPLLGWTAAENETGYALYFLEQGLPLAGPSEPGADSLTKIVPGGKGP